MSKTYFELRLTATTQNLSDYLKNTCISHGSYLNPIKLGSFIHGLTDNTTISQDGKDVPVIDASMPQIDESYDAIKWLVYERQWESRYPGITVPKLQYIEIINMNPFEKNGELTYCHPMTQHDWEGYFKPDGSTDYQVAPNGLLYLSKDGGTSELSVKIQQKDRDNDNDANHGIIAAFNVAFTLEVDGVPYFCIIDPVLKVRQKK